MKRVLALFLLLVVGLSVVLYLELREQSEETARPAGSSAVVEGTEVDVVARIPARIEAIHVREGDRVEAGQALVVLDCEEPRAALARAEAARRGAAAGVEAARTAVALAEEGVEAARRQVAAAEAQTRATRSQRLPLKVQAAAAERAERRVETLRRTGGASEQDLDRARTEAEALGEQLRVTGAGAAAAEAQAHAVESGVPTARLRVEAATRQLEVAEHQADQAAAARDQARVAVDECGLEAPMDAVVERRNHEPGEVVLPGSRVLTLLELGEVRATFYLPNEDLEEARPGRRVEIVADAMPDRVFEGVIGHVAREAEFTPRNIQTREDRARLVYAVDARIDNPDHALRPGMPVEVRIPGTGGS
ncbi:MAG: HlyD family secretion protein [Myxococcota bacterium]